MAFKGKKLTEEHKMKIGKANSGKIFSKEHRRKLGEAHKEKKLSDKTKKKMGEARKTEWKSGKRKMHLNSLKSVFKKGHKGYMANLGMVMTEEQKRKISETNKRRGIKPPSPLGRKHTKETKRKMSEKRKGEKHWNWQNGKSFEPYSLDWTKTLKRSIRERDKYRCRLCGEPQEDMAFCVHHIDYDKSNCNSNNLITLCLNCHLKTNFNRKYWIEYFKR